MLGRCSLFLLFLMLVRSSDGFNIDTENILTFRDPSNQNSMFGYSITLQKTLDFTGVVVGAPDYIINNNLKTRNGGVFLCRMMSQKCDIVEKLANPKYVLNGQMLGATVESRDDGTLLACAPKYYKNEYYNLTKRFYLEPKGKCFTFNLNSEEVNELGACKDKERQSSYSGFCQAGLSATISHSNIYIGLPGFQSWRGAVFKVIEQRYSKQSTTSFYSYMGYSITHGYFHVQWNNIVEAIAVGAPRNNYYGSVIIFDARYLEHLKSISGEQYGAYFGYSLTSLNVDGDQFDDLIVGAPLFKRDNVLDDYETGRIYIYTYANQFENPVIITGYETASRFGTAICSLGKLNNDNYEDFAISAPYAGSGKVYIYHGSHQLQNEMRPSQVLEPKASGGVPVQSFGFSLSGGIDVDGNGYPDIAVGAYESNEVFVFRARPIVRVTGYLKAGEPISEKSKCFQSTNIACTTSEACFTYFGDGIPNTKTKTLKLKVTWSLDFERPAIRNSRVFFHNPSGLNYEFIEDLEIGKEKCHEKVIVQSTDDFWGFEPPIKVKVSYDLIVPKSNELQPILNQQSSVAPRTLSIFSECERTCIPDLQIGASTVSSYIFGDTKAVEVVVNIKNIAQDAFDPEFRMIIPPGFTFQSYKIFKARKVVCSSELNLENEILLCQLANPLRKKDGVTNFVVTLSHKSSRLQSKNYTLTLSVSTSNPETPPTMNDNVIKLYIMFTTDIKLSIYGKSVPNDEIFYDPKIGSYPENGTLEEQLGPEIIHTYSIENTGITPIETINMYIIWPYATTGEENLFLYLMDEPKISKDVVCQDSDFVNVKSVKGSKVLDKNSMLEASNEIKEAPIEISSENEMQKRSRRQVTTEVDQLSQHLNSPKFRNAFLNCTINSLTSGRIAQISVRFRLVTKTLQNLTRFSAKTSTNGVAVITKLPLQITPTQDLESQEIVNYISPTPVSHSIPKLWLIIVSADAGTIILLGLITLLWRIGFFKRKRLPTEQELKCAEYANQFQGKDLE